MIILTNSIDDKLHFEPEEYKKCFECLNEYRPDIYNEIQLSFKKCECFEFYNIYKAEFYTILVKYRGTIGEKLFKMYDNLFKAVYDDD